MIACSFLTAPSSIPLSANELQAATLRAELARLRADVLQAAACRWFQLPFASDCAFDVLRGVVLMFKLGWHWRMNRCFERGWLRSPQNVNASPLPCNRAGTSPLRALVAKALDALRYAPQKSGIAASCLICFVAGFLPWLRLRSVLRASCPTDARGMNRHRRLSRIGTFGSWLRSLASIELARCTSGGNSSSPLSLRLRGAGLAALGRTRSGRHYFTCIGESFGELS